MSEILWNHALMFGQRDPRWGIIQHSTVRVFLISAPDLGDNWAPTALSVSAKLSAELCVYYWGSQFDTGAPIWANKPCISSNFKHLIKNQDRNHVRGQSGFKIRFLHSFTSHVGFVDGTGLPTDNWSPARVAGKQATSCSAKTWPAFEWWQMVVSEPGLH